MQVADRRAPRRSRTGIAWVSAVVPLFAACGGPGSATPSDAEVAELAALAERATVSYAIGAQIGSSLLRQPIEVDVEDVLRGVRDALAGRSEVTDEQVVGILQRYAYLREAAVENNRAGREFRELHARQVGVVKLPSGVQYESLANAGDAADAGVRPLPTDTALAWYAIDNIRGRRLASSLRADGEPVPLVLRQLVPGLREALLLMREGDRWRIVLPPEAAFGDAGLGQELGPNETIVVELELVAIRKGATVVD
jgi:FKBP-type peptidyl-prolyl cis-trans isomerase